jgi:hypothetical protein
VDVGACEPEGVARNIDAYGARRVRGEQPEQVTRAGADVEQHADRLGRQLAQDDRIDGAGRRAAGCRRQLIRGAAGAFANHAFHAFAVTPQQIVVLADQGEQLLDRAPLRTGRRRAVIHPVLFAKAIEQPGIAQELQVTRDARLTLADNLTDLADRQLCTREQRKQSQPRRFGGGAQG